MTAEKPSAGGNGSLRYLVAVILRSALLAVVIVGAVWLLVAGLMNPQSMLFR